VLFQWFRPRSLTDGFFRTPRGDFRDTLPSHIPLTGIINCADSFGGSLDDYLLTTAFDCIYALLKSGPEQGFLWWDVDQGYTLLLLNQMVYQSFFSP
jgi:hypothetical protein